jgi:hypothetical protein
VWVGTAAARGELGNASQLRLLISVFGVVVKHAPVRCMAELGHPIAAQEDPYTSTSTRLAARCAQLARHRQSRLQKLVQETANVQQEYNVSKFLLMTSARVPTIG